MIMPATQRIEIEEVEILDIRLKLIERDCPKCDAVLIRNDNEQCYECLNCGYIDCGDDEG
jgi:ribosomal protein S27AE